MPRRYEQGYATLVTQHEQQHQQDEHYGHKPGEWFYGCDACNPTREAADG